MTNPTQNEQGKLAIERLYIKEQSCKVPYTPGIFQSNPETKPETNMEMNIKNYPATENQIEVVLSLNLTMKIGAQTAVVIEVHQAGLFRIEAFTQDQQAYILGAYCPSILFPYIRKAIADLSSSAGFSPITLPPLDFDQMYRQRVQNQQQAGNQVSEMNPINEPVLVQ